MAKSPVFTPFVVSTFVPWPGNEAPPLKITQMELDANVSGTVPAGVAAGESTDLLNPLNSNKMSTTKKMARKMLVFVAFLMAMGVVKAQEKTVVTENLELKEPAMAKVVAETRDKRSNDVSPMKAVSRSVIFDTHKYPVLLQTGGNVYFTVPSDTSTWANAANWSVDPNNPNCPPNGNNICRVRLNTGQTLAQFLTANGSSSYSSMLSHPQIDRKP